MQIWGAQGLADRLRRLRPWLDRLPLSPCHPFQAYKALYNLGDSWLSWEGLGFACFCLLALATYFRPSPPLAALTVLAGAIGLVAQGLVYGQPSMPAIDNALPMALFWLSAIAMGGCCQRTLKPESGPAASRLCTLALWIALLAGPAVWVSGSATMRESARLWLASPVFWIGMPLIAAAFAASWLAAKKWSWQLAALICAVFLTRMTFFADTAHTAANLGLPFN